VLDAKEMNIPPIESSYADNHTDGKTNGSVTDLHDINLSMLLTFHC
jgi:hypothetical protein